MNGVEELKQLGEAGFSEDERNSWAMGKRKELSDAGFGDGEIDSYFGQPPFDPSPVKAHVNATLKEATQPATEGGQPKPVTGFMDALKAGFGESVTGLLMGKPATTVAPDAPRTSRIAGQVGSLAGDVPAMIGGYVAGGMNPVTGTAGAFALPAGIRKILMDKYEKGEAQSFGDFWDRFSGAFIDTAKGWITGAATGAVGKAIGMAPIASPTAKAAATLTGEVGTMVTMGSALEGKMPEPNDFIDTALTLGFVKGSAKVATKLRNIYAKTGVKPDELAADIEKDPTILHDLASDNVEIPKAYQQSEGAVSVDDIHKMAKRIGIAWDENPAFMDLTESVTGKRHLDDLTPAERENMGTAMAEWEPNFAMGGGSPGRAAQGLPAPAANIPIGDAQQAVLDRIVKKEPETDGLTLSDLYTSVVDNLNPIKQALKAGGKGDLETGKNPYSLERLTRGVMGKATEFLKNGAFDFSNYKTVTRGYEQILEPVKKDLDGFRAYMVSKRAIEKAGQGIETGVPLEEAKTVVREGQSKYEAVHQERIKYREALLDYLHKSGIVSSKAVDAMRDANKDYVPFYRFFEDPEKQRASGASGPGNPIKKMHGSERQIVDPIVSDVKDTFLFVALAEKNASRKAFVNLGSDFAEKQKQPLQATTLTEPEIKKLFNEFVSIKKDTTTTAHTETTTTTGGGGPAGPVTKQTKMIVDRVREALLARGFQPGEADQMIRRVGEAEAGKVGATTEKVIKDIESTTYIPELNVRLPNDAATVFRALQKPLAADEIAVFTEGHRDVYKVDPKVAEAFNGLDPVSTGLIARMVYAPASLLRAGVTITPDFITRNIMRDAVSAFIYAGSNPIKTALGLKSIVTKDTAFHNWMKGGGANATMVAIDRDYIQSNLVDLNDKTGLMRRAWNVASTPLDILRATSELVENSTRLGAVRKGLLDNPTKAKIQALSLLAREATVDFARHGKDTQPFARSTAFFNPAVQGIDRFAREMKSAPLATTAKAFAAVTLPSMLLWYANRNDEEIQNLPRWQKDLFWVTRAPLPDGGSFILRIPKPQEFGIVFGTVPERLLDAFVKDNPTAWKDLENTMLNAFLPSMIPTAAIPIVGQFANRDTFQGHALIPAGQEGLLPEYQYTEYTTETAKALGQLIGAFPGMEKAAVNSTEPFIGGTARALTTPILIENYLKSWTGGMGTYMLQLADKGLREAGVVPDPVKPASTLADIPIIKAFVVRYPSASAQSIQDFYSSSAESQKYFDTIMHLAKEGNPKSVELMEKHQEHMAQLSDIRSTLTEQSQIIRMVYKNPEIAPDEKRQLIDTLYYRMIELSKAGNEGLRQLKDATK